MTDVSVIIPTIRGRNALLREAYKSALAAAKEFQGQVEIIIEDDLDYEGPAVTRNRAASSARGEWIAFLDDDDLMYHDHLSKLVQRARDAEADLIYPWFHLWVRGRVSTADILLLHGRSPFGQPFDATELRKNNYIPVTTLVRKQLFLDVNGFPIPNTEEWPHPDCEDWGLWLRLLDAGGHFVHEPSHTWRWQVHGKNTSGRPDRARRMA